MIVFIEETYCSVFFPDKMYFSSYSGLAFKVDV